MGKSDFNNKPSLPEWSILRADNFTCKRGFYCSIWFDMNNPKKLPLLSSFLINGNLNPVFLFECNLLNIKPDKKIINL